MSQYKIKLVKRENIEISSKVCWVVLQESNVRLAKFFGGRVSHSGYTNWPEWIEEKAFPIKTLRSLTEKELLEKDEREDIVVFSGGGSAGPVCIYRACVAGVLHQLSTWKSWRNPDNTELYEEPYCGSNHAAIIARAVSFNRTLEEGMRLTNTEVSRHAESISMSWDEGSGKFRWDATLKIYPFKATALDYFGEPSAWLVYEDQSKPLEPPEEDILFVEED